MPGEIFHFIRPVCGFPGATFTYSAYIICVCLKEAKQRPDRKGQPGGKFADLVTFFPKTGENINATGFVTEACAVKYCFEFKNTIQCVLIDKVEHARLCWGAIGQLGIALFTPSTSLHVTHITTNYAV